MGLNQRVIGLLRALAGRAGFTVLRTGPELQRRVAEAEAVVALFAAYSHWAPKPDSNRNQLLALLRGTGLVEALHILRCVDLTRGIDGAVCEFGVAQGATSALLANEIRKETRELWLYDSFAGLPPPTNEDKLIDDIHGLGSMAAYQGRFAHRREEVEARLAAVDFPESRTHIVPGMFAGNAAEGPERISFAYIDFDLYQPVLDALHFVDRRASPGTMIIVDDYGYFSEGARTAADKFVAETEAYSLHQAPDGQGHFAIVERH